MTRRKTLHRKLNISNMNHVKRREETLSAEGGSAIHAPIIESFRQKKSVLSITYYIRFVNCDDSIFKYLHNNFCLLK